MKWNCLQAFAVAAVFFVNMQSGDGNFKIGRYENGQAVPVGQMAAGDKQWAPSVVVARGITWLFVAELEPSGFKNLVLHTSVDGGQSFTRRGIVIRDERFMLTPAVVYDPQADTFHLWYSRSGPQGQFAHEIVHASSASGLAFAVDGVKFTAGISTGPVALAYAFRDGAGWVLLVHDYTGTPYAANPHMLVFASPTQMTYAYGGPMTVQREAGVPSIDASYVCQKADGTWWGLFTEWAAPAPRYAWEWTVAETAPTLAGPWTIDPAAAVPFLPFANGGTMISVENPAAPDPSVTLDVC